MSFFFFFFLVSEVGTINARFYCCTAGTTQRPFQFVSKAGTMSIFCAQIKVQKSMIVWLQHKTRRLSVRQHRLNSASPRAPV